MSFVVPAWWAKYLRLLAYHRRRRLPVPLADVLRDLITLDNLENTP